MKYVFLIIAGCLITNYIIAQHDIIDLKELKKSDPNWEIIHKSSDENSGRITYKSQKWLMYFVHWWELNDENKNISVEYASDLLKNLWGMQFKITDNSGECEVNGHKAYYAEATLRNAVKTRFIVWNCEETNRQFVADCNINLLLKTPLSNFELQTNEITPNFCCHNIQNCSSSSKLEENVQYDDLEIRYNLPESWRSSKFLLAKDSSKNIPGYYPNGVTKEKGSLWNLITDSEKQIDLLWTESDKELSEEMLSEFIEKIKKDTLVQMMDTIKYISVYKNFKNTNVIKENDMLIAQGTFDVNAIIPAYKSDETDNNLYKIIMWKEEDKVYFLLASMIAYEDMWRQEFDLTPSEKVFNTFFQNIKNTLTIP